MEFQLLRKIIFVVVTIAATLGLPRYIAADDRVQGVITERNEFGVTVLTQDSSTVAVSIDGNTEIKMGRKKVGPAYLIPGLHVSVEGVFARENQLAAREIEFGRSDFRAAQNIQAGLTTTSQQVRANRQQIQANHQQIQGHQQRLENHQQEIQQGQQQLRDTRNQLAIEQQKLAATTGAVTAVNNRFARLDEYDVAGSVTVYFANGKSVLAPKYKTELDQFAQQAKGVDGYIVQVQGYASAVGPPVLNQRLSMDRANAVVAFLQQEGQIPPTHMLVPAAMGTSEQIASNRTRTGQAENRRAVVKLLQNKGISGQ